MNQLRSGAFLNDNIIAVRLHDDQELIDSPIVNELGNPPKAASGFAILGTFIVSFMAFLVVFALIALAYNKKAGMRSNGNGSDNHSTRDSVSIL